MTGHYYVNYVHFCPRLLIGSLHNGRRAEIGQRLLQQERHVVFRQTVYTPPHTHTHLPTPSTPPYQPHTIHAHTSERSNYWVEKSRI